MRAGLYARVSREDQVKGHSLDEQLDLMRQFCKERNCTVVAEFIEPGITGTTGNRPAFVEALKACEAGQLDVLVVEKQDRFFRNHNEEALVLSDLAEWGVKWGLARERKIISNYEELPVDEWFSGRIKSLLNDWYTRNLSQEYKKGKRGRVKKGLSNASTTPYGYKREKVALEGTAEAEDKEYMLKPPEPDPKTAPAVVLAFESYASGQHSDTDVAGILNRAGYPPSGRAKSGRWTREGVRYLLTNSFYVGKVRYGQDTFPGKHEPLIDRELWDQVQALRTKRGHGKGAGRKPNRVYLLARLARCYHCGLKLVSQTSTPKGENRKSFAYYSCPSHRRSVDCPTGGRFVQMQDIDGQISELVRRLQLPDDWRERLQALAGHREERENIEGQRRYLQSKLRRLRELYLDGDFSKAEYSQRKSELQAQLDALQVPEVPEVEEAGETLESLGQEWANAPKRYQRDMLRLIFEGIYIDMIEKKLVCVKPYPQFAPLFRLDGLREKEGCFYVEEEEARSED